MSIYFSVRSVDDIQDVVQALINDAISKAEDDWIEEHQHELEDKDATIEELREFIDFQYSEIAELKGIISDLQKELEGVDE